MTEQHQEVKERAKICIGVQNRIDEVSVLLPIRFCPNCGTPAKELHIMGGDWLVDRNSVGKQDVCCMSKPERDIEEQHYLYTEFGILDDE